MPNENLRTAALGTKMKSRIFTILFFTLGALLVIATATSLALAQTPTPTPKPTPVYLDTTDCEKLHNFCYNEWYTPTLRDCQFRQEGSGQPWSYASCECQAAREYGKCMDILKEGPSTEGWGCSKKKNASIPLSCTTPPGGGGDTGCGLTLDGSYTNTCDCNPSDPSCTSPILIDVAGNGYRLTNAANGVRFNIRANGELLPIAWTEPKSDDAWLALDRNGNGLIDDGSELFGNFTPQSATTGKNGFIALAEFDKPANGGNGDGLITSADSIFTSLRLWQDKNHNGVSEPAELITLGAGGVSEIDLAYKETRRMDQYGNLFLYRSKVNGSRSAWDVFLTTAPNQ